MSVLSRLKSLEQRADERAARKNETACACGYVETTEGVEPSEEDARAVATNVVCFERHGKRPSHVGFNTVIIAPQPPRAVEEQSDGEGDDLPPAA